MITIVIPTRNRAYTLAKVLPTYYLQKNVSEILFVDDASTDNTQQEIAAIASKYPHISTRILRNAEPMGASFSRNRGVFSSSTPYILFGEDDAYLSENYTEVLLCKLQHSTSIGIASGRLVTLHPSEDPKRALARFGFGSPTKRKTFCFSTCSHLPDAYYEKDITLPLTHALILTTKALLKRFPYDTFYSKGNGFREESDFQMNAYLHGYHILATNDTHCMHLHPQDVKSGGHRISILKRSWYKIAYTHYFYKKYYNRLREKHALKFPRWLAIGIYAGFQFQELGIAVGHFLKKRLKAFFT